MPIYMNYDGITGTGTGKYSGWIVLESCQLGNLSRNKEIVVSKFLDNASPSIMLESVRGEEKKVIIDFVGVGESVPYLSIELENVLISSYSVSGRGGGDKPHEAFSLNFTKITYTSKPTAPAKDPKHVKDKTAWNMAVQMSRHS